MKLRIKIFATLVGLCLLILLPISFLAEKAMKTAIKDHLASVKNQTNTLVRDRIDTYHAKLALLASVAADQPGTKSVLAADYATISEYLTTLTQRSKVSWIVMLDADGKLVGRSVDAASGLSDEMFLKSVSTLASKSDLTRIKNEEALVGSAEIESAGYKKGTLYFGKWVDQAFLNQMGEILQIDLSVSSLGKARAGSTSWEFKPTESAEFRWHARFENSIVEAPFLGLSNGIKIAVGISILVSLLASIFVTKEMLKPLDLILDSTKKLQQGNWPSPMQLKRSDEFGELADAFDRMTSSMKDSYQRLESMIYIDPLTGLDNHPTFKSKLGNLLADESEFRGESSLCVLNIDDFDDLNRREGISGGDQILIKFAEILRGIPGVRLIARNGSDEFMLWLDDSEPEFVHQRIKQLASEELNVTFGMGIAKRSQSLSGTDLLIFAAKQAIAQAKIAGKGKFRVLTEIASGHENGELLSYFQGGSYSAVRALAEAVDAKDEYTRGHSERVAVFSRELARYCGFDDGFQHLIYLTGTLHDVGKIGVPDQALKKAGKLDPEEFEMIKLHPGLGEKIVSQIPELKDTLPGIRHHHERYDGRGYPDQLAGNEISEMARILAIADTFDAMTSNRPYRNGLPEEVALAEIEKNAGTQFDPTLATKFVEMRRKMRFETAA